MITVTAGSSAISGWTVTWRFDDGRAVSNGWNAAITTSGNVITARNLSYNGSLNPGANALFGILGTSSGPGSVPVLTCTAS